MAPEALQALIDQKAPVIIIDVRDEAQFAAGNDQGRRAHPLRRPRGPPEGHSEGHDPRVHLKYRQEELAGCEARGTGRFQDSGVLSPQGLEAEGVRNGAGGRMISVDRPRLPLASPAPLPYLAQFVDRDAHRRQREPIADGHVRRSPRSSPPAACRARCRPSGRFRRSSSASPSARTPRPSAAAPIACGSAVGLTMARVRAERSSRHAAATSSGPGAPVTVTGTWPKCAR